MNHLAAKGQRWLVGVLVGASLCQAALAAVLAYCVQQVFDRLSAGLFGGEEALRIETLFVLSVLLTMGIEVLRSWSGEKLGLGYVARIREELFETILRASPTSLDQRRESLLLPFVGDLTAIKKWVSDGVVRLIAAAATSVLLLIVLATKSLALAACATAVMVFAAGAALLLSSPLSAAIRETRARRGAVANFVSSSIRAAFTIQVFDRLQRERQRLRKRNDALMKAGLNLAILSGGMSAVVHLAGAMLVAATLLVGVTEVQRGEMTIGVVAASISIAGLLAGAVRDLGVAFELWRRAGVAFHKIQRLLGLRPQVRSERGLPTAPEAEGGIAFDRVSVEGLFSEITLEAPRGAIVNIVGASGSGKSTLMNLATRLRDPDAGAVRLAGRDLRQISQSSLRRIVGVASARAPLMRGTIAMNLRYRCPGASSEDLLGAVKMCGLGGLLDRLPERENTRIGPGGEALSAGEVEQLLIARAVMGSPPILVLDAVDTDLDDNVTKRIADALRGYSGTILMAATSQPLRSIATIVWRLEGQSVRVDAQATQLVSENEALSRTAS